MTIQLVALCDAAVDYNGKLSLLGTFDTIFAQQLPAVHPQCSVAIRIVFGRAEEGRHRMQVHFVDDDGKSIMPNIDVPIDISSTGEATFLSRNFVINMQQLKFERAGDYSVGVSLNGELKASIPLFVKKAVAAA